MSDSQEWTWIMNNSLSSPDTMEDMEDTTVKREGSEEKLKLTKRTHSNKQRKIRNEEDSSDTEGIDEFVKEKDRSKPVSNSIKSEKDGGLEGSSKEQKMVDIDLDDASKKGPSIEQLLLPT